MLAAMTRAALPDDIASLKGKRCSDLTFQF